MSYITYWRISSTSGGLATGHLYAVGIPPPDVPRYQAFTNRVPQSKGGQGRQGFINFRALWNQLTSEQFYTLNAIVEAAITAGTVYLTVDKNDGNGIKDAFIDVSGVVHPLSYEPVQRSQGLVYQNVELFANNLTVDSDPSTVL